MKHHNGSTQFSKPMALKQLNICKQIFISVLMVTIDAFCLQWQLPKSF